MNYKELGDRCLEALGEYDNRVAASATTSRRAPSVILQRLKFAYIRLRGRVIQRAPRLFTLSQSFEYTSGARSINLDTVPSPSLKNARIFAVFIEHSNEHLTPVEKMTSTMFEHYEMGGGFIGLGVQHAYYILGDQMFLVPLPHTAVPMRVHYIPELNLDSVVAESDGTGTWTSLEPDEFPEEHHEIIALEAALSMMREGQAVSGVREERDELLRDLYIWATQDRAPGRRQVSEIY